MSGLSHEPHQHVARKLEWELGPQVQLSGIQHASSLYVTSPQSWMSPAVCHAPLGVLVYVTAPCSAVWWQEAAAAQAGNAAAKREASAVWFCTLYEV